MKKILALILAAVMCMLCFAGCMSGKKPAAMKMEGGTEVSVNFMYLLTAMQKAMYSEMVESYGGDWGMVVNEETGQTMSDVLYQMTLKAAKSSLVCEYLHDSVYGLVLDDEKLVSIDNQINSMIEAAGTKENLNELLSGYSSDLDTLTRYFELSLKQSNLFNYFYKDGGPFQISDDAIKNYFENNYDIVTHIYFNTSTKAKEDGSLVSLTEEEIAEKKLTAETVFNSILAGEDFYELKEQYNEDIYEKDYYPNGFFVTHDTTFPTEFTVAAREMQVGEYRMVETSDTGIHIMLKLPMNPELYNADGNVYLTIKDLLVTEDFEKRVSEHLDKITVIDEQMALLNVNIVPAFTY